MTAQRWRGLLVVVLVVVSGALPLLLYGRVLGGVPALSPRQAIEILESSDGAALLVDVRPADQFWARHLEAAYNWPLADIESLDTVEDLPADLRGKTLLVICEVGYSSVEATRRLQALGLEDVYHVRGGLQAWVAAWDAPCNSPLCRLRTASGEAGDLAFRAVPKYEQWAEVTAGFVMKPTYMLAGLGLIWVLRRRRARDLVALRWALIAFLAGELSCMVYSLYYLFFYRSSQFFEYLHGYGMVLAFALTSLAIVEGLDTRVARLSNRGQKCAALELCGPCLKYEDAPCGARRVFMLLAPLHIVLAAIPLFVGVSATSYNTYINGTFYNYSHPFVQQLFEFRYCPLAAMVLVGISFVILWRNGDRPVTGPAKLFFAAGVGAFAFSMFRLLFTTIFANDLVWFDFWEELTELLYIAAIALVLRIFRRSLFQPKPQDLFAAG